MSIDKTPPAQVDFAESMRQAEQEAGVPPDTEFYAEYGVENPEPDETGRVPASRPDEAPVEAEAPTEEAPTPEPEAEPEPQPDPLGELNQKLGRLLNENAELRQQLATPQQPQQQTYQYPVDGNWFQELVEGDPGQAAYWALSNQQPHLYDQAIRAWHETDPVAAGRYERQVEQATLVQGIQNIVQPQIQGAQELATKSQLEQALTNVASRHPDYQEVMGAMTEDTVKAMASDPTFPKDFLEQKLLGSPQDKEQVYETLYRWRKAEIGSQLVEAAQAAPARQHEEARQAKREAFVGSATTTTPDAVEESEGERMSRAWAEARPSLRDAWANRAPSRIGR